MLHHVAEILRVLVDSPSQTRSVGSGVDGSIRAKFAAERQVRAEERCVDAAVEEARSLCLDAHAYSLRHPVASCVLRETTFEPSSHTYESCREAQSAVFAFVLGIVARNSALYVEEELVDVARHVGLVHQVHHRSAWQEVVRQDAAHNDVVVYTLHADVERQQCALRRQFDVETVELLRVVCRSVLRHVDTELAESVVKLVEVFQICHAADALFAHRSLGLRLRSQIHAVLGEVLERAEHYFVTRRHRQIERVFLFGLHHDVLGREHVSDERVLVVGVVQIARMQLVVLTVVFFLESVNLSVFSPNASRFLLCEDVQTIHRIDTRGYIQTP